MNSKGENAEVDISKFTFVDVNEFLQNPPGIEPEIKIETSGNDVAEAGTI